MNQELCSKKEEKKKEYRKIYKAIQKEVTPICCKNRKELTHEELIKEIFG